MAIITKSTSSNVSPTAALGLKTGVGSDTIYVVQGGLNGSIDGGGGTDYLYLNQTARTDFDLVANFTSLLFIESVSLGTKGAPPLVLLNHNITAAGYTNGLAINGNSVANIIIGTSHADTISGGLGTDTLNGGDGSDTYLYTTLADFDAEKGAGLNDLGASGTDTVSISATSGVFTLAALFDNHIEAYTITGTTGTAGINAAAWVGPAGLTLTGGGGANAITGTAYNDSISGGGGADDLKGGLGDDTFLYALATDFAAGEKIDGGTAGTDIISISATSGSITLTAVVIGIEQVVLTGTGDIGVNAAAVLTPLIITGNTGNNVIVGTVGIDTINGGAGNDTITGGGGVDVLNGGEGSDTYIYLLAADFVDALNDTGTAGTDTVSLTATTGTLTVGAATGIEAYTVAGTAGINASAVTNPLTALTLTGGTGVNTLTGGSGNDTIIGGGGADSLSGGAGDDIFDYALATDYTTTEVINGGANTPVGDTLRFSAATGVLTLGNNLTGIEQVVLGGSGANGVNAAAVTNGLTITGLTITGNDGNNTITGTNFADTIDGGAGNDTITGGTGADTLLGGLGNDTFIVALGSHHTGEVINGQEGTDTLQFTSTVANAH